MQMRAAHFRTALKISCQGQLPLPYLVDFKNELTLFVLVGHS